MNQATSGEPAADSTTKTDPISRFLLRVVLLLIAVLLGTTGVLLYVINNQSGAPQTHADREIAQWEAATAENPEDSTAWARLAYAYAHADRPREALETVNRGRKASEVDGLALVEADILRMTGRYKEAIAAYDEAEKAFEAAIADITTERKKKNVHLPPDDTSLGTIAYGRALCRIELKDFDRALKELERAAELLPSQSTVRILLGQQYLRADRPQDAAEQFEQALRFTPDSEEALAGLQQARQGSR